MRVNSNESEQQRELVVIDDMPEGESDGTDPHKPSWPLEQYGVPVEEEIAINHFLGVNR